MSAWDDYEDHYFNVILPRFVDNNCRKRNVKKLSKDIHYVRGVANWAKVIGEPRKNNFDDYREWTVDVSLDKEGLALFKKLGVSDRLRDPKDGDNRGKFYTFKQKEFRADGTANDPIKIFGVGPGGDPTPWPEGKLIGNGSTLNVKFKFQPAEGKKKAGVYIRAIQVLDLIKYESQEFSTLSDDDKFFAAADDSETAEDFGLVDADLDDDIPTD